jgi:hypothetical protein
MAFPTLRDEPRDLMPAHKGYRKPKKGSDPNGTDLSASVI